MTTPTTPVNWIDVKTRLPDRETYGPYPRVLVAIGHHKWPSWGYGLQLAELRFFNGDESRPFWVSADKRLTPIENEAYGVTHWADAPALPGEPA